MEDTSELEKEIKEKIENLTPKKSLFESIQYSDENEFNKFLFDMSRDQAVYCLIESSKAAFRRGAFSLEESEVLSKALRVLVD
jgi:hypothetical protein